MFRKKEKKIILTDKDILHSLNYNIILKDINCILSKEDILYTDYKRFNYQIEMRGYFFKEENILKLYITKLDKFKQLMNNIALYLGIPPQEILYKYEKNSIYCNIYKLVEKYNISKKFDFIIFFKNYDWIVEAKKIEDGLLKIKFLYTETICYSYVILKEKDFIIIASRDKNEFVIVDLIEKKIKIGIKYLDR